jgi:hypothetical protein
VDSLELRAGTSGDPVPRRALASSEFGSSPPYLELNRFNSVRYCFLTSESLALKQESRVQEEKQFPKIWLCLSQRQLSELEKYKKHSNILLTSSKSVRKSANVESKTCSVNFSPKTFAT